MELKEESFGTDIQGSFRRTSRVPPRNLGIIHSSADVNDPKARSYILGGFRKTSVRSASG